MNGTVSRSARSATALFAAGVLLSGTPLPGAGQITEPPPVAFGRVPPSGVYAAGFDALNYRVAIEIPDTGAFIRGNTRIDLELVGAPRDTLVLDLTGLRVTSVRAGFGATTADAGYRQFDGRLFVAVPAEGTPGDTMHVHVDYDGTPDDGLLIRPNVHGDRAAFADNFPDRGRFWFPSIDHPSDKATVEYEVKAPPGWEVVANGRRMGAENDAAPSADGIWRWRMDAEVPTYTMVIGAANFSTGTIKRCARGGTTELRPDGCVHVSSWAYPQDSASAARIFARAGDMVEYYAARFGPYPYHKLAHVQSSTRFGGMENSGAIFYSEQAINTGRLGEVTVAHETAHQWFGDGVTESMWNHAWLSEGFATYFGMQYFEAVEGVERFRELLAGSRRGYLGSQVTDLAIEEASGTVLDWFFDQWAYRPGHPVYTVSYAWNAAAGEVEVTIEQVQKAEWPTFRMPMEIAFDTPAGEVRRRADVSGRQVILRFSLPDAPSAVRLDPDGWVLKEIR